MRDLLVTGQFRKDFSRAPSDIKKSTLLAIRKLRANPLDSSLDTKKLVKITPAVYRIRIGHYRLIYSFTKTTLTLHRFRHRKDIYRGL